MEVKKYIKEMDGLLLWAGIIAVVCVVVAVGVDLVTGGVLAALGTLVLGVLLGYVGFLVGRDYTDRELLEAVLEADEEPPAYHL